jgi:cob(I)alamin adenosyltransferase
LINDRNKHGLIHVYTGDGKGKTTAALGLALRATGHRKKVCMIMFLKGRYVYGERYSGRKIPGLKIATYGQRDLIRGKPKQKDIKEAQRAFEHAKRAVKSREYELLILDELTHVINLGLIKLEEVKKLINNKPKELELVITGRKSPQELIELADYVTEFIEKKHPYKRGIGSRKGIEY